MVEGVTSAGSSAAALARRPAPARLGLTAHIDTFARDHLPPQEQWPEFLFELPELQYPQKLNCAAELLDRAIAQGWGDRPVIHAHHGEGRTTVTYRQLLALANRIAHVLTEDLGLVPGSRVLLRSPNTPMLAACLFAVWKAGCIVVPTMRLLRAKELRQVIDKARVDIALCDIRLRDELDAAARSCGNPQRIVYFGSGEPDSLERRLESKPAEYRNIETASDDVAVIAFTSGTTGVPKAALHFHRNVMAMCDCWPRSILRPRPDDIFCGTPPLAFTYGLGVMLCVPMRYGASTVLLESVTPAGLLATIGSFRCTFVATVPTFYRQMAPIVAGCDISTLRVAISSGEALPDATRVLFREASGLELIDGFGATEMMQTFISHTPDRRRRGATGYVIPGYRAVVLDENGKPCPPGVTGRLAVKGPTGCLYLSDERQQRYVQDGWNVTGDMYRVDEDGYFFFQGRSDDVIVSAGYNISGLEVESMLLQHEAVAECAVVGLPDEERGQVVSAFVILKPQFAAGPQLAKMLQEYVKSSIAPYKYPRRVEFVASLPRSEAGKLQRYHLRERPPTAAAA
jgi:2-aminobenzoate-CoA ligase